MTDNKTLIINSTVLYGLGYLIAVLAASSTTVMLIYATVILPDLHNFGSLSKQLNSLWPMLYIGAVYTGSSAWAGYIVSLVLAHRKNWHAQRFYIIAGICTAILAHLLFALVEPHMLQDPIILTASLVGGGVGGFAYFRWRRKILTR